MTTTRDPRITWKAELAALVAGVLLGSGWQVAHAGILPLAPAVAAPRP